MNTDTNAAMPEHNTFRNYLNPNPLRDTPQVIVDALDRAAGEIRYHQRQDHESRIRFVTLRDLLLEIARGRSSDRCNMGASLFDSLSVVDTLEDILRAIQREQSVPVPPPQSPDGRRSGGAPGATAADCRGAQRADPDGFNVR